MAWSVKIGGKKIDLNAALSSAQRTLSKIDNAGGIVLTEDVKRKETENHIILILVALIVVALIILGIKKLNK